MRIFKRIAAVFAVVMIMGAWCVLPVLASQEPEYYGTFQVVGGGMTKDEKGYSFSFTEYIYDKNSSFSSTANIYCYLDGLSLPRAEFLQIRKDSYNANDPNYIGQTSMTWTLRADTMRFPDATSVDAAIQQIIDEESRDFTNEIIAIGEKTVLKRSILKEKGMDDLKGVMSASYDEEFQFIIPLDNPPSSIPHTGVSFICVHSNFTSTKYGAEFGLEKNLTHIPVFESYINDYLTQRDSTIDAYVSAAAAPYVVTDGKVWSPKKTVGQTEPETTAPDDKTDVIIDTDADDTTGETDVSVPAAIVVGILGAAGAVGAAGASGGDGGSESADDEKRKKSYKMYIRKDFGDCIAYNKPQVTVYARMAEVDENGNEADRPDLSAQIQIFSGGAPVQVEGCTMAGNYMGALVSAEGAQTADRPQSGVVSFLFTGEGGTFRNNVTFRLTGEPYISFPNRGGLLEMTLPMLLGDGGAYELSFEVCDFMQKPTDVRVNPQGDAPVSCEVEESGNNRYVIKLQNNSVKPDKTQASASVYAFELIAENENEHAKNRFEVHLHPEGLSVSLIKMDKGAAQVSCYRDADSPEDGEILPTRFKLELAVAETDEKGVTTAKIVPYAQYSPEFGEMTGTDAKTDVLVQKYECPVEAASENKDGLYRFCPKVQLPDPRGRHYAVNQPISTEYDGVKYTLELPVCLIGEPLSPMAGWEAEYKKFTNMVRYYGISPELGAKMRELAENRSTAELRLLTKLVIIEGQEYYLNEGAEFTAIGDRMQFLETGASAVQWIADQAFSTLLKIKFGKDKGELISAIYMPFRDIVTGLIAESASSLLIGEEIDYTKYDFYKSIAGMLEDIVMNQLSEADTVMSVKELGKLAAVLAAFLTISTVKHYNTDLDERTGQPKRCIYDALTGAAQDLTAKAMAMLAGEFFEKLISGPLGKKLMSQSIHMWLKKMPGFEGLLETQTMKMVPDALKKLFEDNFGAQAEDVIEKGSEKWQMYKDDPEKLLIELSIDIFIAINPAIFALDKITAVIFDYIFDAAANFAPFELSQPLPQDPPYFKDGEAVI